MANRTLNFYGMGIGPETANITVSLSGNTIFSGTIPTQATYTQASDYQALLFSTTIDTSTVGPLPMVYTVNSQNVVFSFITSNYVTMPNPAYDTTQQSVLTTYEDPPTQDLLNQKYAIWSTAAVPAFSAEETATILDVNTNQTVRSDILQAHGASLNITGDGAIGSCSGSADSRTNVYIDGVVQTTPDPRPESEASTWYWTVAQGSTMTYDLILTPST
jgi:hypothetical protein